MSLTNIRSLAVTVLALAAYAAGQQIPLPFAPAARVGVLGLTAAVSAYSINGTFSAACLPPRD